MRVRASLVVVAAAGAVTAPLVHAAGTETAEVRVEARVARGPAPTVRRPRDVTLDVGLAWRTTGDGERRTLQRLVMLFPPGAVYHGARTPSCSLERISGDGPAGCPKGSIVGRGTVDADADLAATTARITVVNGGARRVWFYTQMTNPAVVDVPVEGRIRRLGGRWSYELTVDVPGQLQVVAGTPIYVKRMRVTAGRGDWLSVTRAPTAISTTTTLAPPGTAPASPAP
jgi:hypothetical protein